MTGFANGSSDPKITVGHTEPGPYQLQIESSALQEKPVQSLGRKDSQRREWQPTPLFFPGESHGQRSLADYSPWDLKDSDMAEQLTLSLSYIILRLRNSKYEFLPYLGTVVDTLCHKIKYKYTSALFSTSIFL